MAAYRRQIALGFPPGPSFVERNIEYIIDCLGVNPEESYNGKPFLHHYLANGDCVKALIYKYHVNVNVRDNDGRTPSMVALMRGSASVVHLLLHHPDTDIDLYDGDNRRHTLFYAVINDSIEATQCMALKLKEEVISEVVEMIARVVAIRLVTPNSFLFLKKFSEKS